METSIDSGVISGGNFRSIFDDYDWRAGSILEDF
jgi:hypothetical protein